MARLKSMYRHAGVHSEKSRKLMATSLIQCRFDYAATLRCLSLNKILKARLHIAQTKVIAFMLNKGRTEHVGQDELTWLLQNTGFANSFMFEVSRIICLWCYRGLIWNYLPNETKP